jgi:predicted transposase/invertase (TIGR01784 family)
MKTNNKYKNSVFTLLFSDPVLLRELYCALGGVCLPPDTPVNINTLDNVLFMGKYNDISFEIGGKLVVLIEHQSTINPNMALRLLMYIGRVYEKIIDNKKAYWKNRLFIPQPEFFVLYNGAEPFPDQKIYRLSDSFEKLEKLGLEEKSSPALELVVKVININDGRNREIVNRCKELFEYGTFVAKTRSLFEILGDMEEAVREAIKYCEKHGILREFLKLHAGEVLSMLMTEFNLDDALDVRYEEGWEDGREEGWEKGREEGWEKGREEGWEKGKEDGRFNEKLEIARNLLAEGSTLEFVHKITGLDFDTLKDLQAD